jgi:NAD-dependent deacetylase
MLIIVPLTTARNTTDASRARTQVVFWDLEEGTRFRLLRGVVTMRANAGGFGNVDGDDSLFCHFSRCRYGDHSCYVLFMKAIDSSLYSKIVVLTGAGVSVASGLPTYRGPEGLWQNDDIALYAIGETFRRDPLAVWNAFGEIRAKVLEAEPNPAHYAIAEFERGLDDDQDFLLITQNVDGLHQLAGTQNIVELHGNVMRTKCSREKCPSKPFHDERSEFSRLPICQTCGEVLRPDIVLFGEMIPADASHRTKHGLYDCDLFVAVGTSGTVTPAANFVRSADYEGARTILVNLEAMDPPNPHFQEEYLGRAETLLPRLLGSTGNS